MSLDDTFLGHRFEVDRQHRSICCRRCHVMLDAKDILVPTKDGWACLNCVDRQDAAGFPILAVNIARVIDWSDQRG